MDTKTLHNWAVEAGLSFTDINSPEDAITVWIDAIMADRGWLIDFVFDGLATATDPKLEDGLKNRSDRFFKKLDHAHGDFEKLSQRSHRTSEALLSCYATSYAYQCQEIGEFVYLAACEEVTKAVEKEGADWWGDVCSYEYDMQQAGKEDYYDGQREERLLGLDE